MKRGSVLIESIVSVMILMICISLVIKSASYSTKILEDRKLNYNLKSYINAVMYEIKYNLPKEKIQELFKDNDTVYLNYDENYVEDIVTDDIYEMISKTNADENFIELKRINYDDQYIKFEINGNKNNVKVKEEFRKSWWMDES